MDMSAVPERCSCGAVLPPDAMFCHKCGKPQREQYAPVEVQPPPPPPLLAPVAPPPIGFHNGTAVRIALLAGILSILVLMLTGQLPLPRTFVLIWMIATGFLAVFLYRRRTGQRLSALSGAHLGWICGIFGFVIATIMLTAMAVALSEPSVVSAVRDQMKDRGISDGDVNQFIDVLRTPVGVISALFMCFLVFTVLPAFGGLIGAKFLDRD